MHTKFLRKLAKLATKLFKPDDSATDSEQFFPGNGHIKDGLLTNGLLFLVYGCELKLDQRYSCGLE